MAFQMFNKNVVGTNNPSTPVSLTLSTSYPVYLTSIDGISLQPIYTDATPAAAVMASSTNVTHAVQATATVTVLDYTKLATGDKVTINGVDFVAGTDWSIGASNNATAVNIAALTPAGITGTSSSAVATFTNTAYGTVGNANTITFTTATGGALSDTAWTGGVNAIFTKTAHGLTTGLVGQMTTSSALPSGLSTSTNYYVIMLTSGTFSLASSLANAKAGTPIEFTTNGTGNQTFTPTAINWSFKLQAGNDGKNWVDIPGSTLTITAAGTSMFNLDPIDYNLVNLVFTATAGVLSVNVLANAVRRTSFQ